MAGNTALRRVANCYTSFTLPHLSCSIVALGLDGTTIVIGHFSPQNSKKGEGNPYSIIERRVPELIPVLGSQPAGDVL